MKLADGTSFFVLGMGKSGKSVTRLLVSKGYPVVIYDDNIALTESVAGELANGAVTVAGADVEKQLLGCDYAVLSPGVSLDHRFVKAAKRGAVRLAGELEIAYAFNQSRIIGVTGTNGKSTVVSLLGRVFETAGITIKVAGNIGTPWSDVVSQSPQPDTVVLEISSFQLDTISDFKADVAVLLNVTPDHLDRYDNSFKKYKSSKARIVNRADRKTYFVYNRDDPVCVDVASRFEGHLVPFSSTHSVTGGVYHERGTILSNWHDETVEIMPVTDFPPVGIHNLQNALAAVAASLPFGIDRNVIRQSLATYHALPHRMELVRIVGGVAYINDSKATNVDAAVQSIRSIEGGLALVLGGLEKNTDFTPLREHVDRVKLVVLIGEASEKIARALDGKCAIHKASNMAEAIRSASEAVSAGDTVLLAPACASFDMFKSYEDRGRAFRDAVNAL